MGVVRRAEPGFTLVELMVVILIIGILVAIAIPVFAGAKTNAMRKTCFANQRAVEGAAQVVVGSQDTTTGVMAGVVTGAHPLVTSFFDRPPRCPAAPVPANPDNPSAAEGAYTLNGSATIVLGCPFGTPAHGHY